LFNAELTVFDNAVYRLSISLSSLEIFAVKILRGAVPPKVVLALTPPPRGTSSAKVSSGYTP